MDEVRGAQGRLRPRNNAGLGERIESNSATRRNDTDTFRAVLLSIVSISHLLHYNLQHSIVTDCLTSTYLPVGTRDPHSSREVGWDLAYRSFGPCFDLADYYTEPGAGENRSASISEIFE